MKKKILIVDDDKSIRYAFRKTFAGNEFDVFEASDGKEALKVLKNIQPHVIFLDYSMPELDGFGVMEAMRDQGIDIPTIVITGYGNMNTAIKAVQLGAYEYVTKPLDVDKVRNLAKRAIEIYELKKKVVGLESTIRSLPQQYEFIGNDPKIQEIFKTIGAITSTPNEINVLIYGESGTGKELVARAIHSHGHNSGQPFIGINCTVFPESLMESELFGHEKGAFTGAIDKRIGKFEAAQSGTIFLDEIGDLSPHLQQKFLRVLQERCFERIGSNSLIQINSRIIAATNHNLEIEIKEGRFREDLFYRLNVIAVRIPALRERKDDIPLLADFFLEKYSNQMEKKIVRIDKEAVELLITYDYPGNVRELENIIKGSIMLEKSKFLTISSLPDTITGSPITSRLTFSITTTVWEDARRDALKQFELQFISQLLKQTGGNVTKASQLAKIERQSFQRIMKKHNLFSADFK